MTLTLTLLIVAGVSVSLSHLILVFRQRLALKPTLSENVAADNKGYWIFLFTHLGCDALFIVYAYLFYLDQHDSHFIFILLIFFVLTDITQAALPSKGKTKKLHLLAAYTSWGSFLLSGLVTILIIEVNGPLKLITTLPLLVTYALIAGLLMSAERKYMYQLAVIPLYILFLIFITIGAS